MLLLAVSAGCFIWGGWELRIFAVAAVVVVNLLASVKKTWEAGRAEIEKEVSEKTE